MAGKSRRRGTPIHGWLPIHKATGMTSTQVVGAVRRITQAAKVGHGGTLDPFSEGLLPVALGEATKTMSAVLEGDKSYRCWMRLGVETDTGDLLGQMTLTGTPPADATPIEQVLSRFTGTLEQVPPIFSAIHIQGERAYAKARRGETFEMAPRCVHIHRLTLESYQPDEGVAQLIVECGKGTYMRALARDIGRVLGCGAHLEKLLRLTTLGFTLDEAITLQTLQDVVEHGALETVLLPIDRVLDDIPVLRLDMEAWHKIRNGQAVWIKAPDVAPGTVRLYGPDGCFGALGALEGVAGFPGNRHCRPQRLFFTQ